MHVGVPGWQWPLQDTFPQPRSMTIALRRLGFDVGARGGQTYNPIPRERLELQAFARAFARAFPSHRPHPDYSGFLTEDNVRALDHASAHPGIFALEGALPPSCCIECHFETENREILPYVRAADLEVLAKALELEHAELIGASIEDLKQHARDEMDVFRRANVPLRLMAWLDAEHRDIERGKITWKKS